jgi:hypothetical protein
VLTLIFFCTKFLFEIFIRVACVHDSSFNNFFSDRELGLISSIVYTRLYISHLFFIVYTRLYISHLFFNLNHIMAIVGTRHFISKNFIIILIKFNWVTFLFYVIAFRMLIKNFDKYDLRKLYFYCH